MATRKSTGPPRPLAPGDIVAAFCETLGEWAAAQVTGLDPGWKTAGVLALDWSGPEPASVTDLGQPAVLRLTHHRWAGKLSHVNYEWLLPRGCKVIGTMPLLHSGRAPSYSRGWRIGEQLAMQRRWDAGDQGPWSDPREVTCTGAELNEALARPGEPRPDIWSLDVRDVKSLREWDGRAHISRARFAKATAQYKVTRRAVMAALPADDRDPALSRLAQIGREYAEAFNRLDNRAPFIETEEREELFAALDLIITDAQAATGKDLAAARQSLIDGAEAARDW